MMKIRVMIVLFAVGIAGAMDAAAGDEFAPGLQQYVPSAPSGPPGVGGLGFSILAPSGNWPELGRYLSPFIANFRGGEPVRTSLGLVTAGDGRPASSARVRENWVGQTIRYNLAGEQTMELTVSRLSPAILLKASGGKLNLLDLSEAAAKKGEGGKAGGKGGAGKGMGGGAPVDAFLRYVAVPTASGIKIHKGPAAVEGEQISEPWLVCWFGQSSPAIVQGQDCPLLLVFQHRPQRVQLHERKGLSLQFAGDSGYVAVMALAGFADVRADQSEKWSAGLPEAMTKRARQWAPLLRHYPTDVKESYRVDVQADRVIVREEVTFLSTEDDWKTPARKLAPLPPILAAANRFGLPLRFSGAVVDLNHIENAGLCAGIEGVDQYTWEASGLLKYLRESIDVGKVGAQAAPLRRTLEKEVRKMLKAGHLRAGYFSGGLLDSGGTGAWDFWVNPGELVTTLGQAAPLLDEPTRKELREYLAKEVAAYPPWRIGHIGYGKGHPRELYDIPPEELDGRVGRPTVSITQDPKGPPSFDCMYAMWSYGQVTGDWETVKKAYGDMDSLFRSHLRNYDWSIMGQTAVLPIYPTPFGRTCGVHTCDTVLAGLIGYHRLASRFGKPEDRDLAAYLAVKQLVYRFALAKFQPMLQEFGAFVSLRDLSVRGDSFSRLSVLPYEKEEKVFPFMREVNSWEKEVQSHNSQFVLLTEVVPNKKYARISFLNLVPEVG